MSKKEYLLLGSALFEARQAQLAKDAPLSSLSIVDEVCASIADALQRQDDAFDWSNFMLTTRTGGIR